MPPATINREKMVAMLIREFPSIESEITDEIWQGLSHLEIAVFARYTNAQINNRNESELVRCFSVANELLNKGDKDLDNAIHVSYLELLDLNDRKSDKSWARALMPRPLLAGYEAFYGPTA
jgi:hypothetical protein